MGVEINMEEYYRRHLPHYQPDGATYHVVFRLKGSVPAEVIEALRSDPGDSNARLRRLRRDYGGLLEEGWTGPTWLRQPEIANVVKEAMLYRDGKDYDLNAFCIMPNHVHLVIELVGRNDIPTDRVRPLFRILQSMKRHTARQCNLLLKRHGAFWQDESYDHVVRNEDELERTIWYVLNNPVKAGLVQSWEEWPWTYVNRELLPA